MQNSSSGSGSSVPATTVVLASSIPSITISRPQNQKIPVIPLLGLSSQQAIISNPLLGKKTSASISSSIPPVVHTYSRPRILGRGREVNKVSPGKILQQHQTPPTPPIAIASTSAASECGNSLLVANNSAPINPVNWSGGNSSQIVNALNKANSYFNVIPCNENVSHPSILIGTAPPSKSPPASKLIVRIPSLSPVRAVTTVPSDSLPVPIPMQITDIQVVDEAEIQNQEVQSVVQVEIDYQTLVALNDMEPAEENFNIHNGEEEMEIDRTTVVLNVPSGNSPKPADECTYVISQDEETQVINFIEIESNENNGQTSLENNECKEIEISILPEEECNNEVVIQNVDAVDVIQEEPCQITAETVVLECEQPQVINIVIIPQSDSPQSGEVNDAPKPHDLVENDLVEEVIIVTDGVSNQNDENMHETVIQVISQNQFLDDEIKTYVNGGGEIAEKNTSKVVADEVDNDKNNTPVEDLIIVVNENVINDSQNIDETNEIVINAQEDESGKESQVIINISIAHQKDLESVKAVEYAIIQDIPTVEAVNFEMVDIDEKLCNSKSVDEPMPEVAEITIKVESVEVTTSEPESVNNFKSNELKNNCIEEVPVTAVKIKDETENSALVSEDVVQVKDEAIVSVPAEMNHNSESPAFNSNNEKSCIPLEIHSDNKTTEDFVKIPNTNSNDITTTENIESNNPVEVKCKSPTFEPDTMGKEVCAVEGGISEAFEVLSKEAQLSSPSSTVAVVSPSDVIVIDMVNESTTQHLPSNPAEVFQLSSVKSDTCEGIEMVNTDTITKNFVPPSSKEAGNKNLVIVDNINTATETICKKQSSEASLIPRIPIADEAYNNAEDETDKIVAAKVPVNEYEAQVVEPAEPEPANIRVIEQPPIIRREDLLDEPPDEIEVVGKAALQWRNGIGHLPGSNLKFKINELNVMELIMQEDENENEGADMDVDAVPDDEGSSNGDKNSCVYEHGNAADDQEENEHTERKEFESTENDDSISDRSGSISPEYYLKPPPRAKFSIMSNMKNSSGMVPPPASSPEFRDTYDGDADEREEIDTCLSCGRFGLKSELTNSKCTPCMKTNKKKTKIRPPPIPSQSESTSEENFKVPKPYVPYKSIYPIIPRKKALTMKLQHLTQTITTTMTNSAAIVLGIKDKAVVDSLNAGIGLSCSKMIQEAKAKGAKRKAAAVKKANSKEKKRNSVNTEEIIKEMPHLGSPEKSSCDEKEDKIGEMPKLKVNEEIFEWPKYLGQTKSKAANQRLFRQPAFPPENPFKRNMVLEAIDPQHQSLFCLVIVVETQGYRMRLRFVGFSEIYDFWMNADSLEIFPCGWCEEHSYKVEPPPGIAYPFDWRKYTRVHGYTVAPRGIFAILHEEPLSDSGVQVGMKLEAVDIRNQNLVCVATVANVMGDRFLVHFDSWDTLYDYWTDVTSPFIHPIGWCEENGVELTPPNNFKAKFSWESYLRSTKCEGMPTKLFQPLPPVGFKKGAKIECVDKRNPSLVRVATIAEVEGHELVIHFDNWPSIYDYKVYELSPDIHPVGWCNHTDHILQAPPPMEGEWEGGCKTFGCNGDGNMKGPKFISHNTEKYCPYSISNYKKEDFLTDRIVVFERNYGPQEKDEKWDAPVVKIKKSMKRPLGSKTLVTTAKRKRTSSTQVKEEIDVKPDIHCLVPHSEPVSSASTINSNSGASDSNHSVVTEPACQPVQTTSETPMLPNSVPDRQAQAPLTVTDQEMQATVHHNSEMTEGEPAAKRRRMSQTSTGSSSMTTNNVEEEAFHSQEQNYHDVSLKVLVDRKDEGQVRKWKTKDVVDFVSRIPGCKEAANLLVEHEIDGESFLLLTQSDLTSVMGFKMGPAVKLANAIRLINGNSTMIAK